MEERAFPTRDFERLRAIFDRAVELPPGEHRARVLSEACAGDSVLLTHAERLLARDADLIAREVGGPRGLPRFGAYQATRLLGRGGMGVVYEAHRDDGEFERRVAVKVLPPGTLYRQSREDLRAERRVLSGLVHPGIAQLFDGGVTTAGDPYLVVEFIDGEHIDVYCDRRQLTPAGRLALLGPILDAVEYAHSAGVIHLDLKPSNIVVTPTGQPKLIDFGLAAPPRSTEDVQRQRFTPEYAAPELLVGGAVDGRTDVFALGVIYSRLLGDAAKSKIVQRATAASPAERYQSIGEFREALFGKAARSSRARWAVASLVAGFLLLAAGAAWWTRRPHAAVLRQVSPPDASWRHAALSWSGEWWAFSDGESSPVQHDIWVCRKDGSGLERLMQDDFRDEDPTLSPDGRFVAFRSNREPAGIHEFDRSTRRVRLLVAGGHQPKYSPDGRWLMYATADNRDDPNRSEENQWFAIPAGGGPAQALAGSLCVTDAVWAGDSRSVWLRARKAPALQFNSVWRKSIGGEDASLALEWPNNTGLCAASAGGDALFGLRYPEHALLRIPLPKVPRAPVVAEPTALIDIAARPIGCSTSRTGRVYLHHYDFLVKNYLLPAPVGSHPPREIEPGGLGIFSVSLDGRTVARKNGEFDMVIIGPFGTRNFSGTPVVSGDGRIVWVARPAQPGLATATAAREPFPILREHLGIGTIWSASADGALALGFDGTYPRKITALSLESDRRAHILADPARNLYRARPSADSRWVTFTVQDPARGLLIHAAPFRGLQAVPVAEWKELAEGTSPVFAPAVDRLFFTSKRDGNWCIYALNLHPGTIQPSGDPLAAAHLHGPYTAAEMPDSTFHALSSEDGVRFSLGRQRHRVFEYVAP